MERGLPAALDFAITATQRRESLVPAADTPLSAANSYDYRKRHHLDTEAACAAQGVQFIPLVMETTGTWSLQASKFLKQFATVVASRLCKDRDSVLQEILQGAVVAVRRVNTRAVLKRSCDEDEEAAAATLASSALLASVDE